MKRFPLKQGSALITVVLLSAGLVVIVGALIAAALQSYRMEKVNEGRDIARAIAESELEQVYYQFKTAITKNHSVETVPSVISADFLDYSDSTGSKDVSTAAATFGQPQTLRDPSLSKYRPDSTDATNPYTSANKWQVKRSLVYNFADKIQGQIGNTRNHGSNYYLTAMVEVVPPPSFAKYGLQNLKVGRQMVYSVYTVLQNALFYQGDLEMNPGTSFDVKGDIAVNGSIYMGAANQTDTPGANVLNLFGNVTLTGYFNTDADNNTTYFPPNEYHTTLNGTTVIEPPVFKTSRASQLVTADTPTNFLGGIDVSTALTSDPGLFSTANDVYRAIITPPPKLYAADGSLTAPNHDDYGSNPPDDDPTIANVRLYNMASVIITIAADGSVTANEFDSTGKLASSSYSAAAVGSATLHDQREGKDIKVTNIDISKFSDLSTASNYEGVVYINQVGAASGTVAVRLIKGESTPYKPATSTQEAVGFTLATNGPLYIQGDLNSATLSHPTVILADSVTALSAGWDDAQSSSVVTSRVASGDITINAAIMTGNTPTTSDKATSPASSGGAQNLVRYLEDWGGKTVTLNGSLGRLFDSKYFTGAYQPPGKLPANYYCSPTRNIKFDTNLAKTTPKGAPSVKSFSRGAFFNY